MGPLIVSTLLFLGGIRPGSPQTKPEISLPNKIPASGGVRIGKPLFVSSATIMCGPLESVYPFAPETYGLSCGYSPATSEDSKIVLYTHALDKQFFRLASDIDALAAKNKKLAGSMVIVIDEKGAQYGGYSIEEVKQRREAIRRLVTENKITHLSFFLSAPNAVSIAPSLRLTNANLLIAFLVESNPAGDHAIVQWFMPMQTTQLDEKALTGAVDALKNAVSAK